MNFLTNTLIQVAPTIYCYGLYKLVELKYLKYLSILFGIILSLEVFGILLTKISPEVGLTIYYIVLTCLTKVSALMRLGVVVYCVYAVWERIQENRLLLEALLIFPIWLLDQKIKYYQTPLSS